MKACSKCKEQKPFIEFNKRGDRDAYESQCKSCRREYFRKHSAANRKRNTEKMRQWRKDNPDRDAENGRKYRADNKESIAERNKQWYLDNQERHKKLGLLWRSQNRSRENETSRRWSALNKDKVAIKRSKRRCSQLQRTPAWADNDKTSILYSAAKAMDFFNPCSKHHVDHVIPLRGKTVSGLHVHTNLQILTDIENVTKGNRYDT